MCMQKISVSFGSRGTTVLAPAHVYSLVSTVTLSITNSLAEKRHTLALVQYLGDKHSSSPIRFR
jgi:hypothetical protein